MAGSQVSALAVSMPKAAARALDVAGQRLRLRGALSVEVVLEHDQQRQLPLRGDIERLVDRPLAQRAVADEHDGDPLGVAQLMARAIPAATGTIPPWMPLLKSPCEQRCWLPPRPPQTPDCLPMTSAISPSTSPVRARKWPWPRWLVKMRSPSAKRLGDSHAGPFLADASVDGAEQLPLARRGSSSRCSTPRISIAFAKSSPAMDSPHATGSLGITREVAE